jgi:hypothetical protein
VVAYLAVAASGDTAWAQEAPATAPVEAPATAPVEAPATAPVEAPATAPVVAPPVEPATPAAVPPVVAPPAAVAPTSAAAREIGVVLGVGVGVEGASGVVGDLYGPAFGLTVMIGARFGATSLEARTTIAGETAPRLHALQGVSTTGGFEARSVLLRQQLLDAPVGLAVFAGIATASVPLLRVDPIVASSVGGTGGALGASVTLPLGQKLELAVDLTAYRIQWELPPGPYVRPAPGSSASAESVMYTSSIEDLAASPWTASVGLRVRLD